MGETGCGKTKLIRFMTRVAKYGHESVQNLFLLKVQLKIFGEGFTHVTIHINIRAQWYDFEIEKKALNTNLH